MYGLAGEKRTVMHNGRSTCFSIRPSFIRIYKNYSNKNSSRTLLRGPLYQVIGIETAGDETEE